MAHQDPMIEWELKPARLKVKKSMAVGRDMGGRRWKGYEMESRGGWARRPLCCLRISVVFPFLAEKRRHKWMTGGAVTLALGSEFDRSAQPSKQVSKRGDSFCTL